MGFKTKIQQIRRKCGYNQWFVNFPSACAQMMNFSKGETVEWEVAEDGKLFLKRVQDAAKRKKKD